jgi:hypothetical protein
MKLEFFPILAVFVLVGCASGGYRPTPTSDAFHADAAAWNAEALVKSLAEGQAPAEFECELQSMTFKALGSWRRIRATGCGKTGAYQFVDGVGWVLNGGLQEAPAPAPAAAPPAEAAPAAAPTEAAPPAEAPPPADAPPPAGATETQ